LIKNKI